MMALVAFLFNALFLSTVIIVCSSSSQIESCSYNDLTEAIKECFNNGHVQNGLGSTAPNATKCLLKNSTAVVCHDGVWNKQRDDVEKLGDSVDALDIGNLVVGRHKRFLLDTFVCFFLFCGRPHRPRDTTPPVIRCLGSREVTAEPLQTYAIATWPTPTAIDNKDGTRSVRRVFGRPPGRHFPEGNNVIVYRANDRSGNSNTCTITVIVRVIRCPAPSPIINGYFQCFPNDDHVLSGWCKFGCYNGFELHPLTASVLTCKRNSNWSAHQPKCVPLKCSPPPDVLGAEWKCSDGFNFRSICTYSCQAGFDMPPRVSKTVVCSNNKQWRGYGIIKCVDIERPTFKSCPSLIVAGTDTGLNSTEVKWTPPVVVDNSNMPITPTLKAGEPPGSKLTAGSYTIVYTAIDGAGNKARPCRFKVTVRDTRCPRLYPTPYAHFICPDGYRTGTVCDVTCDAGKTLSGPNNVQCAPSDNGLFGEWSWKNGKQTTCINTRKCQEIKPPTNGAIVCDNWQGGKFCQAQCKNGTEMASVKLQKLYVCSNKGSWLPLPHLKKCGSPRHPHLHAASSASCYFPGDCSDTSVQEKIRSNFIHVLSNSLFQREVCPDSTECNAGNVQISCGATERRKRETRIVTEITLHISLPVKIGDETDYAAIHRKCSKVLNETEVIASEVFQRSFSHVNTSSITYVRHGLNFECPDGSVKSSQNMKCIDCPEGSYFVKSRESCELCSKGTYQDMTGKSACNPCPYGKTTRNNGSASFADCEHACPPGSFSADGLFPCSLCEVGHYQQLHGQVRCHECMGSKSTVTVGATSFSQCQEFDIDFLQGNESTVMTQLSRVTTFVEFTLSLWIKVSTNDSRAGIKLSMQGKVGQDKWIRIFRLTEGISIRSDYEVLLPDSRWHQLHIQYQNCSSVTHIDKIPLYPEVEDCSMENITHVVLSTDESFSGSVSQINLWNSASVDLRSHWCHTGVQGNVLKWQEFGDAIMDGDIAQMLPSECDDFDNCVSSPCVNGVCADDLHGYSCDCQPGFTGQRCETNIDDCDRNICMNGGRCVDGVEKYSCQCGPDFTGQFCEIAMVHGGWTSWGNWSECTTTCGAGNKTRTRSCTNPNPDNGGRYCDGQSIDVNICNNTECAVCLEFIAPANGRSNCTRFDETLNCSMICNEGYEFDIEPLEVYHCGPDTFHFWNFETEENPERHLPKCIRKHVAQSLSVRYVASYKDLFCTNNDVKTGVKLNVMNKLHSVVDGLPCIRKRTCSVDEMQLNVCSHQERQKRSSEQVSFAITISTSPTTDNETDTLLDLQDVFEILNQLANNGKFTIEILGQTYELDLNSTNITGNVQCSSGMTRVNHYCVPCGKGAYLEGNLCQFCFKGTYQDTEGQTQCILCPEGHSTMGIGATDITECTVAVQLDPFVGVKVGAIVGGCVSGIVAILLVLFTYRRYRAKKKCLTSPTNILEIKPRPSTPASTDMLGPRKTVFSSKELQFTTQ